MGSRGAAPGCGARAHHRLELRLRVGRGEQQQLVVRLEGTNVEKGKEILANSGLAIVPADDLGDAARKIVAEVKQAA